MALSVGLFGSDGEEILWQSGVNLYIKMIKQEKSAPPNDHPVTLTAIQITEALNMLEIWEKENYFSDISANRVFSISQSRLLGNYLSKGLSIAKPDQDIIFALATLEKGKLGISPHKLYMAGRAFFHADRLHIIIGDYDRPPDKGREVAEGGAGVTETQYFFTTGSRKKSLSGFKKNIIIGNGIEVYIQGDKRRHDWFVINVPVASSAFITKREKKETPSSIDSEAIRQEAARLANERRQMRAEMARMRKEMQELSGNSGDPAKTVEERIAILDELLDKKMITQEEYDKKRQEILNEI